MMHVESPMQTAEEKPPGNKEAALAINLANQEATELCSRNGETSL